MFKVGDVVIVNKPNDTEESPGWVSDMDEFDGKQTEITHDWGDGTFSIRLDYSYVFHESWFTIKNTRYWRVQ